VIAAAMAMAAVGAVAFVLSRPQPTGEVAGIVGTPAPIAAATEAARTATNRPVAAATHRPSGAQTDPARPTAGPTNRAPRSVPTRPPTGGSTPAPTPRPTSRPTPEPAATPTPPRCVAIAPNLVGERRSNAARLWRSAGFSGAVTALSGHGNYKIATQDRAAGTSFDCTASLTVGP
jgi:hypothetical protein